MVFRVLGPIEIEVDGRPLVIHRRRERHLIGILAVNVNQPVSRERLSQLLWPEHAPDSAMRTLQSHVSRVRAVLSAHDGVRLDSEGSGYVLRADPELVDAHRFRALLQHAAEAPDVPARVGLLTTALGLWRGPVPSPGDEWSQSPVLTELNELRAGALEDWLAGRLELGHGAELIAELSRQVDLHPGRERLVELLMRALHRVGRIADALGVYEHARAFLADELGLDPGPRLRELQLQILRGHSGTRAGPRPPVDVRPAQLPLGVQTFIGRATEIGILDRLAAPAPTDRPTTICVISGTAGVGKTALALHWAHRAAARFPDGQLYVDLQGYDVDQPLAPEAVLAGFLRALGVADDSIPPGMAERAARYRTALAGRRMLVVLDNAASVEQVRPLLPGSASCLVLVTSRDALTGLVARNGARRIPVDLLPRGDAVALLRALIGPRVAVEPAAAVRLAELCARLPLALRVAAEVIAGRPGERLTDLIDELVDEPRRLDRLDAGGDNRTAVRAVLSWSYQYLSEPEATMFRVLGLHPGADFDLDAAAALCGLPVDQVTPLLNRLRQAHLVHPVGTNRSGMHSLLRDYAATLAVELVDEADRAAAVTRLVDHYTVTAEAAARTLHPGAQRDADMTAAVPVRSFAGPGDALAWLDAERANLVATCILAEQHRACAGEGGTARERSTHAIRIAAAIWRFLDRGGFTSDALTVHRHALDAAGRTGDRTAQAEAFIYLGVTYWRLGRLDDAVEHLRQSLVHSQDLDDPMTQARATNNLGMVYALQGRYAEAVEHLERALLAFVSIGHRIGECAALTNLGLIYERQGRYQLASEVFHRALTCSRQSGDAVAQVTAMTDLGLTLVRQGHYEDAVDHLRSALTCSRTTGDRINEAHALANLGLVHQCQGRYTAAVDHLQQALVLFEDAGDRTGITDTTNGLAEAWFAAGQFDRARVLHETALTAAVDSGDRWEEARARNGLGRAHAALDHPDEARRHWERALVLFTDLDVPEADSVRAYLDK